MPLRDRSGQSCQPFWHGVRGRSGRSLFKTRWSLSGPLSPSSPYPPLLLSLPFWGIPECNTQVYPSPWCVPGRLRVAGNTCFRPFFFLFSFPSLSLSRSLSLSLSLSLSFSLSLFFFFLSPSSFFLGVPGCVRHSWEPFSSSLGVSLDACVVDGNTFFSFPFFFFFLLFSPCPSLLSGP